MTALAELPERHRIAFEMHRIAGCTLREIAATLGVSVSQAQVLVVEGIEHCKQRMRRLN
jgi:RNA polymerase sigma factor (sigma-70 family)